MDLTNVLLVLLLLAAVAAAVIWVARAILRRRGRSVGYDELSVYLRSVPDTEEQKLDALDLALKGAVLIVLGVIFPPLIIVGLVPLYFGLRKVTMTLMGLGLPDGLSD